MNSNEVAKLAGVSRSTVSRVINNYTNVPEETRKRVLEVIKQNNYVPHASARVLAGADSKIIGLFMVDRKTSTNGKLVSRSSYFSPFMSGVIDNAAKLGYHVLAYTIGKESDYNNVKEVFYNKTIAGGIFIGQQTDDYIIDVIKDGFKVALIDHDDSDEKIPKNSIIVNADNFSGAYKATQYLISIGHKKIAHISGNPGQLSTNQRIDGYKKALSENKIRFESKYLVKGNFMRESGYTATKQLLSNCSPTAIFYANDSMAIGGMEAIKELGLSIPKDISIIGFDDIEIASFVQPSLTTVQLPLESMCASAVDTLINSIKNKTDYYARYIMPVELIKRNSCRHI